MNRAAPLDLGALQAFVLFCECGSMTQTAQRLGVTQSAVSQLIKRLERDTGMLLVDRDQRPPKLTSAGYTMLELASDLISHARSVADRVRIGSKTEYPQLKLGCVGEAFAATVGPALIQALSGTAQDVRLWSGLTPVLAEQLVGREIDIAVCNDAVAINPRINQVTLFSEGFVLVVPQQDDDLSAPQLRETSLALPLMRYSLRSSIGQQVERYLRHIGVHAPRRFEFDATGPMLSMIAAGLGWGISTPLALWQSRHTLGEVSVYPLPDTALGRREFFLLSRLGEWAGLEKDVLRVTREVMQLQTEPAIRKVLTRLPADCIRYP